MTIPTGYNRTARYFVPARYNPEDGRTLPEAVKATTHMSFGAHQDDAEIMAYHGIALCFLDPEKWFSSVIMTDGSGSPSEGGPYSAFSKEQMGERRTEESWAVAMAGRYAFTGAMNYPSGVMKDRAQQKPTTDIRNLLLLSQPEVVYTHTPTDKHDTHVAVVGRTVRALRDLAKTGEYKPQRVLGCEVWRFNDWIDDADPHKVQLDTSALPNLREALLSIYDSQIAGRGPGGNAYDLATVGLGHANAVYAQSHDVQEAQSVTNALNLMPLIEDPAMGIDTFVQERIASFSHDVATRLQGW